MTHPRAILLATALWLPLPATADMTPDALWQAWQDNAAAAGLPLSATVEQGGTLALIGLSVRRPLGDGTLTLGVDRLDLAQDGADVRMTLPVGGTVTLVAAPGPDDPEGDTVEAVFALADAPLSATATGDAADPDWTVAADTVALELVSLTQGGTPVDAEFRADLGGLAGRLTGLGSADRPLSADLSLARMATAFAATDADSGDTLRTTATQSDATLRADLAEDPSDPDAWSLRASLAGGESASVSVQSGPTGSFETDSRQDSSVLDVTLTDTRSDYGARVTGLATTLSGSMLPAGPLGAAIDTATLNLSVPTGPAPDLQTAQLALDLQGVMPDDRLWALIDPMGALPRDPAAATLRAEADLASLDPDAAAEATEDTAPGMDLPGLLPRALRIAEIAVNLGTASIAGDGAVDIPAGPMGVPDMDQATGAIDLRGTGLNGLLQQAMAAGAVNMEQAMGAQMLLGMFAVQGEGDSFTTRIELQPDGALLVNGNRLR